MTNETRGTPSTIWGLLNQERAIRVWAVERALGMTSGPADVVVDVAAVLEAFVLGPAAPVAQEKPSPFNEYGLMKDLGDDELE